MKAFSPVVFRRILSDLDLDLSKRSVLTEAATGPYAITAVISAFAGAETYVHANDSAYGTAREAYTQVQELAESLGCAKRIHRWDGHGGEFDIITNSGHLRPIDQKKLQMLKPGGVIPLMYENWELRPQDIDLDHCRKHSIPVVGVNERHPDVDVFGFLGDMAAKLAFDSGRPLYRSRALLLNNNDFGPYIARRWSALVDKLYVIGANAEDYRDIPNIHYLSDFSTGKVELADPVDLILYTAAPFTEALLGYGQKAAFDLSGLEAQKESAMLLRFCGHVRPEDLNKSGLSFFPQEVKPGHMGVLPSHLGMEPVIRLQSGGLKAAELYLRGETEHRGVALATPVKL